MTDAPPTLPGAAPLRPDEERTWAVLAHVLPLVGPGFVAPLAIRLVFRGRGAYLEHHAREALNFQITALIAFVAGGILVAATFGALFPLPFVLGLAWYVLAILAAVAAGRWEWYHYPWTLRLVS